MQVDKDLAVGQGSNVLFQSGSMPKGATPKLMLATTSSRPFNPLTCTSASRSSRSLQGGLCTILIEIHSTSHCQLGNVAAGLQSLEGHELHAGVELHGGRAHAGLDLLQTQSGCGLAHLLPGLHVSWQVGLACPVPSNAIREGLPGPGPAGPSQTRAGCRAAPPAPASARPS